jgi:Tfp pilus assembly protein PilZ
VNVLKNFFKDKRGDAVLLFMLFLIIFSILFMYAVHSISRGVGAREELVKICDEIALNIAVSAVDMQYAQTGDLVVNTSKAYSLALNTFKDLSIPVKNVSVTVKNKYIYVTASVSGEMYGTSRDITVTGMAKARDVK